MFDLNFLTQFLKLGCTNGKTLGSIHKYDEGSIEKNGNFYNDKIDHNNNTHFMRPHNNEVVSA